MIPAITFILAILSQLTAINIHLELNFKDFTRLFNRCKAKIYLNYDTKAVLGLSFPYFFCLKGHLKQKLIIIGPMPNLYYWFKSLCLGGQEIFSNQPIIFKFQNRKLLFKNQAMSLNRLFEKSPAPTILVNLAYNLNFIIN